MRFKFAAMNDAELKAIIEEVIRILLARESAGVPPSASTASTNALIIVNGSEFGHAEALALLRSLANPNAKIFPTPCYVERYGLKDLTAAAGGADRLYHEADLLTRDRLVDEAAALVYLLPKRAGLAKLATAQADSPAGEMIMRALLRGIPCHAAGGDADESFWPKSMPATMRQGRNSYRELLNDCLDRLAGWGLSYHAKPAEILPRLSGVATAMQVDVNATPKHTAVARVFLTAEDIQKKHSEGVREMRIVPGVIMTDQAREKAASLMIKLIIVE